MPTDASVCARLWVAILLSMGLIAPALVAQQKPAAPAAGRSALKPVTAKAYLGEAIAAAKKWRADAFLIQLTCSRVSPDGTCLYWDYGAYSPSAKKCAIINVINGQANAAEAGGPECAEAKVGDFIDSNQAMTIAKQNGLSKQDVAMSVLNSPHTGKQVIWMIIEEGLRNKGDLEIDLDAATGKVISADRRP